MCDLLERPLPAVTASDVDLDAASAPSGRRLRYPNIHTVTVYQRAISAYQITDSRPVSGPGGGAVDRGPI